jgi:hypothetical protein
MNFGGSQFTRLCFGSFDAILYPRVLFLLVFVLPVKGKGPRCSGGGFGSCGRGLVPVPSRRMVEDN